MRPERREEYKTTMNTEHNSTVLIFGMTEVTLMLKDAFWSSSSSQTLQTHPYAG